MSLASPSPRPAGALFPGPTACSRRLLLVPGARRHGPTTWPDYRPLVPDCMSAERSRTHGAQGATPPTHPPAAWPR